MAITLKASKKGLTVGEKLTLTSQFTPTTEGDTVTKYEYFKNDALISGASGETYEIASVKLSDAGKYTVKATITSGEETITETSDVVDITVKNKTFVKLDVTVTGSTNLNDGDTLTLDAVVDVDPTDATLAYQWAKDGVDINGETKVKLTKVVGLGDAGDYTVKVTGSKTDYTNKVTTSAATTVTVKEVIEPVDPSELNHIFEFTERKSCGFTIGWWVKDEIDALTKEGKKWRDEIDNMKYKKEAKTLAYALDNYDHIEVMETRNGYILKEKYFTE